MMVSLTLIGLIFGAIIAIYTVGSKAWRKGNIRGELLQELQVITNKLSKDVERTDLASLTITPDQEALSCLKLYDKDGNFLLDALGRPIWSSWVVYFKDGTELRYREVEWTASEASRAAPAPIESFSPPLTLADYRTGGKAYTTHLEEFELQLIPDTNLLSVKVSLEKTVGEKLRENLTSEFTVRMRN